MRTTSMKIKKSARVKILANEHEVKIRFPKQSIGNIALSFSTANGAEKIIKQWELVLIGDRLTVEVVKS